MITGGNWRVSGTVSIDVTSIHASGVTITSATGASSRCQG